MSDKFIKDVLQDWGLEESAVDEFMEKVAVKPNKQNINKKATVNTSRLKALKRWGKNTLKKVGSAAWNKMKRKAHKYYLKHKNAIKKYQKAYRKVTSRLSGVKKRAQNIAKKLHREDAEKILNQYIKIVEDFYSFVYGKLMVEGANPHIAIKDIANGFDVFEFIEVSKNLIDMLESVAGLEEKAKEYEEDLDAFVDFWNTINLDEEETADAYALPVVTYMKGLAESLTVDVLELGGYTLQDVIEELIESYYLKATVLSEAEEDGDFGMSEFMEETLSEMEDLLSLYEETEDEEETEEDTEDEEDTE